MKAFKPAGFHLDAIGAILARVFPQRALVDRLGERDTDRRQEGDAHGGTYGAHSRKHDGNLIRTATSESSWSVVA